MDYIKKIYEKIKPTQGWSTSGGKMLESKVLVRILYIIGIVIIATLIFSAGVTVGFHKASFGRAWGEHYNENFGMGHRNSRIMGIDKDGVMDYFPNAHGATGKIIKIELPSIIVEDKDNTEKVILIKEDTKIQKTREEIARTDLKLDDFVIIIGTPDAQGQIEAKFIRVLPSPEFLNQKKAVGGQ